MTFNIGDKVRLKVDYYDIAKIGYIGTVLTAGHSYESDLYIVEFSTHTLALHKDNLELAADEPKAEDMTKYVLIYRQIDGEIVAYHHLFDTYQKAYDCHHAVSKAEDFICINEINYGGG